MISEMHILVLFCEVRLRMARHCELISKAFEVHRVKCVEDRHLYKDKEIKRERPEADILVLSHLFYYILIVTNFVTSLMKTVY